MISWHYSTYSIQSISGLKITQRVRASQQSKYVARPASLTPNFLWLAFQTGKNRSILLWSWSSQHQSTSLVEAVYVALYFSLAINKYIHDMTWHDMTLHYIPSHGITWHYMTLHGLTWHHIASHCITLHSIHTYTHTHTCVWAHISILHHNYTHTLHHISLPIHLHSQSPVSRPSNPIVQHQFLVPFQITTSLRFPCPWKRITSWPWASSVCLKMQAQGNRKNKHVTIDDHPLQLQANYDPITTQLQSSTGIHYGYNSSHIHTTITKKKCHSALVHWPLALPGFGIERLLGNKRAILLAGNDQRTKAGSEDLKNGGNPWKINGYVWKSMEIPRFWWSYKERRGTFLENGFWFLEGKCYDKEVRRAKYAHSQSR